MHAFPLVVAKFPASFFFRPGTTTSSHTATASATWWPTCLPRSKLTSAIAASRHIANILPRCHGCAFCQKTLRSLPLCAVSSDSWPTSSDEVSQQQKENVKLLYCTVLAWDGVMVWECCCLQCCAQQWNKVLRLWDQWPPFSLCRCTRQIRRKAALPGLHLVTFCFKICKSCNLNRLYWIEVYKIGASSPTWGPNDRLCNCLVFQVGKGRLDDDGGGWWWWRRRGVRRSGGEGGRLSRLAVSAKLIVVRASCWCRAAALLYNPSLLLFLFNNWSMVKRTTRLLNCMRSIIMVQ